MTPTPKLTTKPPIVRPGTTKAPLDPHTHEIVKSVAKFLGKINRHLNETHGHKIRIMPSDAKIVQAQPSSAKK